MKYILLLVSIVCVFYSSNGQVELDFDKLLEEIQTTPIDVKQPEDNNISSTETTINIVYKDKLLSLDPVANSVNQGNNSCEYECVPFYQCNDEIINTNGENIFDIRVNDGPCGSALLTCCQLKKPDTAQISVPASTSSFPKGCGFRNQDGVGFTITGNKENEAQFAEFPWMVSISGENELQPACGGALIHPQAVVTAAHCVANKTKRFIVKAGEWDITKKVEPLPHQEVAVDSIIIHPKFYSGALFNDIAFLYLKSPLTLADNVNTICLPPQDYQHKPSRCYTTGWGKDKFGQKGKYHVILKKIDLPIVPRDVCQENLRKTRLGKYFLLHSSFICAGGEKDKDACNGDGGSPLVCPLEEEEWRYYHAGIVAWGIGCGEENIPGVYVDVAKFRDWIDQQMKIYNLDPVTYDQNVGIIPRF